MKNTLLIVAPSTFMSKFVLLFTMLCTVIACDENEQIDFDTKTRLQSSLTEKIPDLNFRALIENKYGNEIDVDADFIISEAELESFDALLNVSDSGIQDLTGIELFDSLKTLLCDRNNLTAIDLSSNTNLELLTCSQNNLEVLNLYVNTKLYEVLCSENELKTLIVPPRLSKSGERGVFVLNCSKNKLSELTYQKQLTFINCVLMTTG